MTTTPHTFIDSHCHFDFDELLDKQLLWHTASSQGIKHLLIPGVSPEQWQNTASLCQDFPAFFRAIGIHPWWGKDFLNTHRAFADIFEQHYPSNNTIAIGETGLDKHINFPLNQQMALLVQQLDVAQKYNLPVILHCRGFHNELISTLKKFSLTRGGIIHAFSGSRELAKQYWALGFYLGIGGTITYDRANKTRKAVQAMPLEALLLETDAPDMPIDGKQGQPNKPEYIPLIAEALSELKETSIEQVAKTTTQNFYTLFNLDTPAVEP